MSKLRVLVIYGGRSGEHEISLLSARSILKALDREKYEITEVGITHSGNWVSGPDLWEHLDSEDLSGLQPALLLPDPTRPFVYSLRKNALGEALVQFSQVDVIWPVLHGTFGEDGTIQGLFELMNVAYVGAGVVGSALGMDKAAQKDVLRQHGVPVVESMLVLRKEFEADPQAVIARAEGLAGYPLFVKPANLGSSVGISKCANRSDLYEGLMEAARFDRRLLIERGVRARELEVSVLGNEFPEASVVGEVLPSREFYSYEAKYIDGTSGLLIPAPIPEKISQQVRQNAIQAYRAIDCAGMARVDFLWDQDRDQAYLNEINTLPGFTSISMYPKLWEASGLSYARLADRLIELALERKADRDHTEWRYRRET
jgi:D-alanine-D-alanine ligase